MATSQGNRTSLFAGAGIVVAAAVVVWYFWPQGKSERPSQYFYDLSEKKLYPTDAEAFAPEDGIGGEGGDGVEAVVFLCPECPQDIGHMRIAYLKTHTPEFKQRQDARKEGAAVAELTRAYELEHTLISLPDQIVWVKASSEEAVRIGNTRKQRCPEHGAWEKPVRP